jgi:hypothetical protein
MSRSFTWAAAVALGLWSIASGARAWDTQLTDEVRLDLRANMATGYVVTVGPDGETEHRPYLRMGRLRTQLELDGAGWTMLQVDIAGGQPRILDAVAALTPTEDFTIRFGKFKVPISADFLIPLPTYPLTARPQLTRHAPRRRLGVDARGRLSLGSARLDLDLGLFAQNQSIDTDGGKLLAARAALWFSHGLGLHVGYGQLVFSNNEINPTTGGRPEPYDRLLDLAVVYEDEHVLTHFEGLMVFDGPDHEMHWGAAAMIGYTFGDRAGPLAVQPVLNYDFWSGAHERGHRMGGALNFQLAASRVILRLDYEATFRQEQVGHAVMFEIQMSL